MSREGVARTVLFVHASNELYGSDRALLDIIRGLDRNVFRPLVVVPDDLPYEGLLTRELNRLNVASRAMDLAVIRRSSLRWRHIPGLAWRIALSTLRLRRFIHQEDVRLVHTNTVVTWPGALAAYLCRVAHVWHVHEIVSGPRSARRFFGLVMLALSAAVVTNSRATRYALFGPRTDPRIRLVPNGVAASPPCHDAKSGVGADRAEVAAVDVTFGTVGRISRRKGLSELLVALAWARAAGARGRLVIVGSSVPGQEAVLDELHRQADALGLTGCVTFLGFQRDAAAIMKAVDVLVVPVLRPESFGLVAAEAMALGKPVIASNLPALDELIVAGETGLLVPPGDTQALGEAMARLAADPDLRQQMGRLGRQRVSQVYPLATYQRRFSELYASLACATSDSS